MKSRSFSGLWWCVPRIEGKQPRTEAAECGQAPLKGRNFKQRSWLALESRRCRKTLGKEETGKDFRLENWLRRTNLARLFESETIGTCPICSASVKF